MCNKNKMKINKKEKNTPGARASRSSRAPVVVAIVGVEPVRISVIVVMVRRRRGMGQVADVGRVQVEYLC
jgi:hypothetical protein